jgi:hypothetical protein
MPRQPRIKGVALRHICVYVLLSLTAQLGSGFSSGDDAVVSGENEDFLPLIVRR